MGTHFQKIVFCVLVLFRVSGTGSLSLKRIVLNESCKTNSIHVRDIGRQLQNALRLLKTGMTRVHPFLFFFMCGSRKGSRFPCKFTKLYVTL